MYGEASSRRLESHRAWTTSSKKRIHRSVWKLHTGGCGVTGQSAVWSIWDVFDWPAPNYGKASSGGSGSGGAKPST